MRSASETNTGTTEDSIVPVFVLWEKDCDYLNSISQFMHSVAMEKNPQ